MVNFYFLIIDLKHHISEIILLDKYYPATLFVSEENYRIYFINGLANNCSQESCTLSNLRFLRQQYL